MVQLLRHALRGNSLSIIYGIDVSHYEPGIDWEKVSHANRNDAGEIEFFAFTKASEGLSGTDSLFRRYWREMKASGIPRGAYHFFHPNLDPVAQADHFLGVVGMLERGDLPYVLDLEVSGGVSPRAVADGAVRFLEYVGKHMPAPARPILYASPSFIIEHTHNDRRFAEYPLWLANYGVKKPHVPAPWADFTFWQYTEHGKMLGVPQVCDVNQFRGSLSELKKLCVGAG